jgi:hypothetical protein
VSHDRSFGVHLDADYHIIAQQLYDDPEKPTILRVGGECAIDFLTLYFGSADELSNFADAVVEVAKRVRIEDDCLEDVRVERGQA